MGDDGSSDRTFDRLAALAADDPRLRVIKLRRNYGRTPALAAGIDHTRGEILVTMDADLQNDPADIGRLVEAPRGKGIPPLPAPHRRAADAGTPRHLGDAQRSAEWSTIRARRACFWARLRSATIASRYWRVGAVRVPAALSLPFLMSRLIVLLCRSPWQPPSASSKNGHDLVVGWRRRRQDAWLRSWLSRIANRLIAKVTGVQVRDNGCTLKAFRAELIKSIPLYSEMHRFLPALMSIRGCRLLELPVNHQPRRHGSSKYGFSRIYKVFFDLMAVKALLVFTRRPLLCFFGTTAATLALAILSGTAALYHVITDQGSSAVIFMALSVLLGSLAIFLALGGTIVSIAYTHFLDPGADPDQAAEGIA